MIDYIVKNAIIFSTLPEKDQDKNLQQDLINLIQTHNIPILKVITLEKAIVCDDKLFNKLIDEVKLVSKDKDITIFIQKEKLINVFAEVIIFSVFNTMESLKLITPYSYSRCGKKIRIEQYVVM